ncbi:LysR substrate-binding domain-containing protein [Microvirga sp. 17 mud 1-3]|uniref:LysR substrate-binding domain-containing protein n=1 Tax=Microvirga sp. 17 mud 1-3 TaxID=2082949 RepID=UPI000D6C198B|nr:LysR substrate-binding domain-containing protein [Microvirga sp. 17 mud 1-3]AWM86082.1 LysR family transcriptional regulator [Microvirga sp. 17 mud 1-3]
MAQRRLPSLNALVAFEAAARLGRMTLAAEELSVTHGAISRQVRHLETVLGIRLFEGPKNALRLTEAGRTLLSHLTTGFDHIETGIRAVADEEEGALDVSCTGTFSMRWLIPRLYRFQELYPGIEVRLSASHAPVDFTRHRYEVAIRLTEHLLPPEAPSTTLFAESVGPVLSPALAARLHLAEPRDLAQAPLLHTVTRPYAWSDWIDRAASSAFALAGTEYEHFYYMLEAAVGGLGVGIAPWQLVIDDIRAGRLVAPFGFVGSGMDYVAVRRPRRSRKAQAFCTWLAQEAGKTPLPLPMPMRMSPAT